MTNAIDGIITQIKKEDIDESGDYIGPATIGDEREKLKGDKTALRSPSHRASQKPRWGRLMQTLCCCISPQAEPAEKSSASPKQIVVNPPPNSSNPITQITKVSNGNSQQDSNGFTVAPDLIPPAATIYKPQIEKNLLPTPKPHDSNKKCLIIDLDETLVHSSFKPVKNPDFVIPVEIDGVIHQVYVLKRPYVDEFLARIGDKFECVLFTASLAKYADPVADLLDKRGVFRARLFREACVFHKGNYIKDLARLGRDLSRTIIVDNSPTSYTFHPENAIPVQTWFDDPSDVELLDILPVLDRLAVADSVYSILRPRDSPDSRLYS